MDRTCLTALKAEAERLLRHELQTRFPDLAAAFDVRLADRSGAAHAAENLPPAPEHIDW